MKVMTKDMQLDKVETGADGTRVLTPTFYGGGRANVQMLSALDANGDVMDEAMLQVSSKGKLVLVRKKDV